MLNLAAMRVFAVAAETENFSETARRLHLSQPAVSQQVQSLEHHLGIELFLRSGRSIRLTDAGRVLLPRARQLLAQAKSIEEMMWSLDEQVVGSVVIGCTTTAGKYAIPVLAAAFRKTYPKVRLDIRMLNCTSIEEPLLAQEVHLGTSTARGTHPDMDYQPYFTDRVALVVPSDHPFAERSSVSPSDLLGQPFIWQEEGCSTCQMVHVGLAENGIGVDQMNRVMSVGNAEAIEMAVGRGLGIAFISRLAASRGFESGRLVEVPVEGMCLDRSIYAVRNARSAKTLAQERLWTFIGEYREKLAEELEE
jgi:LysR family transcriptional regulator, transcriptional activator of the cysJI operon